MPGLRLLLSLPVHQGEAGGFRSCGLFSDDEGSGEKSGDQPEYLRAVREGLPGKEKVLSAED
jgi:hypothetical protein